jgi:hypothetical protein
VGQRGQYLHQRRLHHSRVAKIAPDGRWLGSWGSFGSAPGEFNTLHSIQVNARDEVYVADRGNRRIQVFDTAGTLLRIIQINVPMPADAPVAIGNRPVVPPAGPGAAANKTMMPGAPWALCSTVALSQPEAAKARSSVSVTSSVRILVYSF